MSVPVLARQDHPAQAGSSIRSFSAWTATLAEQSLRLEIQTWPKPGLVSHVDTGSHGDMDAATFFRSASAIRPFFAELVEAGIRNEDMTALRQIGLRAERAMLRATGNINTHRGAIFGMGLLCAAAGLRVAGHAEAILSLGEIVRQRWGQDILAGPRLTTSHGEMAGRRYGAGGARLEAALGFATVYDVALPALADGIALTSGDTEASRVHACFALIATLNDTNLLHRGGDAGLNFAQQAAKQFIDRGGVGKPDWPSVAAATHRAFIQRRLSPGGAADLLAMGLFIKGLEQEHDV